MFIGYNKARRSGLSRKDFLSGCLSSKSLKNPRLAVEWRLLYGASDGTPGTI
jgi:hypothetical protein